MTTQRTSYHHGDLRAALVASAMAMLERGDPFSIRAIARDVGVSPTAPYRHFPDRQSLESALAVEGFRDLQSRLDGIPNADGRPDLLRYGVAYVDFALDRPALFTLMFGQECDRDNDERVVASDALGAWLQKVLAEAYPAVDVEPLATAVWGLVHGLTFLHLDGKLPATPRADVEARVRAAMGALLTGSPLGDPSRRAAP